MPVYKEITEHGSLAPPPLVWFECESLTCHVAPPLPLSPLCLCRLFNERTRLSQRSRPPKDELYDVLKLLGAPHACPRIGYRQPFAMIGYKGAPQGTAVFALEKTKVLLRLEAELLREGGTTGTTTNITAPCPPPATPPLRSSGSSGAKRSTCWSCSWGGPQLLKKSVCHPYLTC